jgi:hypothetical protein
MITTPKCEDCAYHDQLHYMLPNICTYYGDRRYCEDERFPIITLLSKRCGYFAKHFQEKQNAKD